MKVITFLISAVLLFMFSYIYADIDGRTGRTLKTTTSGCSCHGAGATSGVSVIINGPDTVNTGQTIQFSLTITRSTKTGAGLDVAVRQGSLGVVSANTHIASGEITHSNNLSLTSGTITVPFNYNAPGTSTIDTIFATGLATNSQGNSSGDEWNWALSKRVVVRLPSGINNITSEAGFNLSQNYPNPFNPSTTIKLDLGKPVDLILKIYDAAGKEISILHSGRLDRGVHLFKWEAGKDNTELSSGIYYYEATGDGFRITKKMMLVR